MIRSATLAAVLTTLAAGAATAQTTLYYREGERVEPQDVRRILDNVAPRTRSIRLLNDAGNERASPAPMAARDEAPSALSLPVRFEFDSSVISPSAREQLDALAEGIKLLPAERIVAIEGHTDAAGTEAYNQVLSRRRAAAVKHYLVERHGIPAGRLRTSGYGERRPIAGTDPLAAANRRVQFRGS